MAAILLLNANVPRTLAFVDKKELIGVLSAQKEEQPQAAISKPSMASIDKFVNSIESLQQRLDGLSLDEIIETERKADTLKDQLIDLQNAVTALSNLKQKIAEADRAIEQAPVPSLSSLELESKPLHLQQLLAVSSKLIPFPRPVKTTRDKAKTPPVDAHKNIPAAANKAPSERAPVRATTDHKRAETPAHTMKARNDFAGPSIAPAEARSSKQKDPTGKLLDFIQPENAGVKQITAPQEVPEQDSRDTAAVSKAETPMQGTAGPEFPRQDELPSDEFEFTRERIAQTRAADDGAPIIAVPETSTSAGTRQPDFDQRLLDDLIKNYGEFAVSPNLPAVLEPEVTENKPKRQPAASAAHMNAAHGARKSNLPVNKKEAEIDRQLKQIIKDYGQYDLYSHPGHINLKKGVIAAFALLGVLFFVFYFFFSSTPPPHTPPARQQEPLTVNPSGDKGPASATSSESNLPTEKTSTQQKN